MEIYKQPNNIENRTANTPEITIANVFTSFTLADRAALSYAKLHDFGVMTETERNVVNEVLDFRYWQILLQKSVAADGLSAIWLVSTGFDPPTLAALRNFDATLRAAPSLSRRRSCD